jgi:nucleoredoxin
MYVIEKNIEPKKIISCSPLFVGNTPNTMSTKKELDTPKTAMEPMEELLGETLFINVKGDKISTKKALQGKDFVALYFSAKWCPPCRQFSPILKDFYKACADKGKVEIVYISSDHSLNEFKEYYETMPWMSLPEGLGATAQIKNTLSQKLQIRGIPTLVVLEAKTGKYVTNGGREDVMTTNGNPRDRGVAVIEKWKATEAVPLEQANLQQGGSFGIMSLVKYILKNPMAIIAL